MQANVILKEHPPVSAPQLLRGGGHGPPIVRHFVILSNPSCKHGSTDSNNTFNSFALSSINVHNFEKLIFKIFVSSQKLLAHFYCSKTFSNYQN